MAVLGVLIFVALPDGDPGAPSKTTPKRRRNDKK
jgi:hypothetical protein